MSKELPQSLNVQVNAAWQYLSFVELKSPFSSKVYDLPPHILKQADLKRFVTPKKTRKKKIVLEKPKNFLQKIWIFVTEKFLTLKKKISTR